MDNIKLPIIKGSFLMKTDITFIAIIYRDHRDIEAQEHE